jgi:hypothetical protein
MFTAMERADLTQIISLLAAKSRRRGPQADPLPFLTSCLANAGFPAVWSQTLASYVVATSLFRSLQDPANGAVLGQCMETMLQDALENQSAARKEAQQASTQAQVSQILRNRTLLTQALRRLKSGS